MARIHRYRKNISGNEISLMRQLTENNNQAE